MSNFKCEICGINILEDEGGHYYTECEHYPLEKYNLKLCRICNGVTKHNTKGKCLQHSELTQLEELRLQIF